MPIKQHLDLLRKNVEAWNNLRARGDFIPDLGAADLRGANLRGADLRGADLREANLGGANLKRADLRDADLRGANLVNADARSARFGSVSYQGADFSGMDVRGTSVAAIRSQWAIDQMRGDENTRIRKGLTRPAHWTADFSEAEIPPAATAEDRLLNTTAAFDVVWTADGQLDFVGSLSPVAPELKAAAPATDESAQMHQLAAVGVLARQTAQSIRANAGPNVAPIVGDIAAVLEKIADEVEKPSGEVLIVVIRANLRALANLSEHAVALTEMDIALYESFLAEGQVLLRLFPILQVIDNPHREDLVPEDRLPEAVAAVDGFVEALTSEETEAVIGPKLPGATRDTALYPWVDDRQKVAVLAAVAARVKRALETPPEWVMGLNTYAGAFEPVATRILLAITALMNLL
ncbi:MAG: pentapeptide repeat-containing protein [Paracoccaceae bacterium]